MNRSLHRLLSRTVCALILVAAVFVWAPPARAQCFFNLGNNPEEFGEFNEGFREFFSPYFYNPNDNASVAQLARDIAVSAFGGPDGSGCFIIFGASSNFPQQNAALTVSPFANAVTRFAKYLAQDNGREAANCDAIIFTGVTCDFDVMVYFESSVQPFFERPLEQQQGLVPTTTTIKTVLVRLKLFNNATDFWNDDVVWFDPNFLSDPGNFLFGF